VFLSGMLIGIKKIALTISQNLEDGKEELLNKMMLDLYAIFRLILIGVDLNKEILFFDIILIFNKVIMMLLF
jgi:hypothetical protein